MWLLIGIRQDGIMLAETIASKADGHTVSSIESNLQQVSPLSVFQWVGEPPPPQVSNQLSRLSEVLQDQNKAIRDLNHRVTRLSEEVEESRNPNYDEIFAYVDKQVK